MTGDLFDRQPPHRRPNLPDTSHRAYELSHEVAAGHQAKILAYLRDIFPVGATKDQIGRGVELTDVQVARVMAQLERLGVVRDTQDRGLTPAGRPAIIWAARQGHP